MSIAEAGGTVHWLEAGDGVRLRVAHWPTGPRGVVLLLNGRTEFIEKYQEPVAALQARGFAVWTLDWRGQGLSTRPLPDPHRHHVWHFDEYLGDLDILLDRHVLPSLGHRPLVLLGHSMGGHIGARMLARRPQAFARAVLCAPMIDFLRGDWMPGWVARSVIGAACLLPGRAVRYGPGAGPVPATPAPFEGNRLTTDPDRYAADLDLIRAAPDLALGGVTWGWLRAAMDSIAVLRQPETRAAIDMPVLVAMAGAERIVDNAAIRAFAMALRRGKAVKINDARHELLRETDAHQALLWSAIDSFLDPIA